MQEELDFDLIGIPGRDGLTTWRSQRQQAFEAMARANGLPLGHRCRVELRDGVELEGVLELATEELLLEPERDPKLQLRVRRCTFAATEIRAVARLD